MGRRPLLALAAVLLAVAGCSRPPPLEAHPALYRVSDGDTVIWLFGTVHSLPPGTRWQTPAIAQAIMASDELVTEIPAADANSAATTFARAAQAERPSPVLQRLPAGESKRLLAAIDAAGLTLAEADRLDSWALATLISGIAAKRRGASAAAAPEAMLAERFAGRPHLALETQAGQLGLFDALPKAAQRQLLAQSLDDLAAPMTAYDAALKAWATGDEAAIASALAPMFRDAPVAREALLTSRNRRWSAWIAQRMARPGTVFVAVGAGHLAGPGSVPAMLKAGGWTVARVG